MSYSSTFDISAWFRNLNKNYPEGRMQQEMGATINLGRKTNIEPINIEMALIFYVLFLLYSFVPGPHRAALKHNALQKAKFFQDKKYVSRVARNSRHNAVRNFTRNTSHTFKNGKKVIKTVPK